MGHKGRTIAGGLVAALVAMATPASAAPTGLEAAKVSAPGAVTLARHGFGGFGSGPHFSGHMGGIHMGGVHGFRSFGGGPHMHYGGPVRFSGNWNHHWHGGHHHHHGYPIFFYGGYGGYYPYYDDYYYDDYDYSYYGNCYYSRRYHARICPDY